MSPHYARSECGVEPWWGCCSDVISAGGYEVLTQPSHSLAEICWPRGVVADLFLSHPTASYTYPYGADVHMVPAVHRKLQISHKWSDNRSFIC